MALTKVQGSVWDGADNNHAASLIDFGAVGDGTTVDDTAVQAALDSTVFEIDGGGKTYRVDTTLTRTLSTAGHRRRFKNCIFDFSNNTTLNDILFDIKGTLGSSVTPSSISIGDTTVTIPSTTGWSKGDWGLLESTDKWAVFEGVNTGEWFQVREVTSGTVLTPERQLGYAYSTSIQLWRPTLIEKIEFENCHFIGAGDAYDQEAVRITYANYVSFRNCTWTDFAAYNTQILHCVHVFGSDCSFLNGDDSTGLSYGFTVARATNSVNLSNIHGQGLRHVVTLGGTNGIVRNVLGTNISGVGCTESVVDGHGGSDWVKFEGVVADHKGNQGSSEGTGVTLQGAHCVVCDVILNGAEGSGILLQPSTIAADDFMVARNCTLYDFGLNTTSSAPAVAVDFLKGGGNIKYIDIEVNAYSTQADTKGVVVTQNASASAVACEEININMKSNTDDYGIEFQNTVDLISRVNISGSYKRQVNDAEVMIFQSAGSGGIAQVILNVDQIVGGTYGVRNVVAANVTSIRGNVRLMSGQTTGQTLGNVHLTSAEYTTAERDALATIPEALLIYNTTLNSYNFHNGTAWKELIYSDGGTGGAASAGAGNQYVEIEINGNVYKVLHDGTV